MSVDQTLSQLGFVIVACLSLRFLMSTLRAGWLFFLSGLFLFASSSDAATVAVVLSDSSAPYQETADAIESRLSKEHTVVKILVSHIDQNETALADARQIVTVGVKAARAMADRHGKTPVLAVLIPKAWYEEEGKSALNESGHPASAIFIDQPFSRQFHFIKSALPTVSRVGVVLSRQGASQLPELERQARAHRMALYSGIVESGAKLVDTLERVLDDSEILLLAFPDSDVLSRTTAQSIFMTSYRFRDPVVGYSQSLSRAGALLTLYSKPAQIGRQTAEVLERALAGEKLPAVQWPQYFSVSVNEHVARSLDIPVPPEEVLMKRIQDAESHD